MHLITQLLEIYIRSVCSWSHSHSDVPVIEATCRLSNINFTCMTKFIDLSEYNYPLKNFEIILIYFRILN